MKKVIEQEDSGRPNIVIQRNQNNGNYLLKSRADDGILDMIIIMSEKSREVALAICPDLEREKEDSETSLLEWVRENVIETQEGWQYLGKEYTDKQLIELYKNRYNENT